MGFEPLLGNDRLKENLRVSVGRGRISHFYLLSGPAGAGKHTLTSLLAAALVCKSEEKPCLRCNACRKVMQNSHPDFITVDDPEKKTVPVDLLRQARADMYVRPNEADRKIYLLPRAQDIAVPGQNALLKILEEPPAYGVFILLTENPQALLPTIRSRCTELRLTGLSEEIMLPALRQRFPQADEETLLAACGQSGGYLGQAIALMESNLATLPETEALLTAFAQRDGLGLVKTLVPMEKWSREQFLPALDQWLQMTENALCCRQGGQAASPLSRLLADGRSAQDLQAAIEQFQKAISYAQGNVSVAAICGHLQWALR